MLYSLTAGSLAAVDPAAIWATAKPIILLALGFSLVIFVHELGHFLAAKWAKVKVEQFAIGFGQAVLSYRQGLGVRFGSSAEEFQKRVDDHLIARGLLVPGEHPDDELVRRPTERERTEAARALGLSETEYRVNWMPLGGYVKMLGQEDFVVDKSGELKVRDNEDSFTNKSVGARMVIVSAGVIMNLIFAAVVFTIVMMVGVKVMPNVIGAVVPDSPAGRAGLQAGDKIVSINGSAITSYKDIQTSVVLSDSGEELVFEVERDGKRVEPSPRILPEFNKNEKVRQIGVTNGMSRRVLLPDIRMAESQGDDELHPRDELYQLVLPGGERKEFKDLGVFIRAMQAARGKDIQVVVRRPKNPDNMTEEQLTGDQPVDSTETLVNMRAMWVCSPETPSDPATLSFLGLVPRVTLLMPMKTMLEGGVENGDILRRINDLDHPTLAQARDTIVASPNQKVTLEVCRPLAKNNGLSDRAVRFCVAGRDAWIAQAGKQLDAVKTLVAKQAAEDKSLTDADRKALAEAMAKPETFPEFRLWLDKVDVHVLSNVTPKPPFSLLSWLRLTAPEKPTVDVQMVPLDDEQIVVATVLDTVDGRTSPARAAGIPVGAIVTAVDGQPVRHWSELTEALRERCGQTATIAYRVDSTPGEAKLAVPMEISAALKLGAGAMKKRGMMVGRGGHGGRVGCGEETSCLGRGGWRGAGATTREGFAQHVVARCRFNVFDSLDGAKIRHHAPLRAASGGGTPIKTGRVARRGYHHPRRLCAARGGEAHGQCV